MGVQELSDSSDPSGFYLTVLNTNPNSSTYNETLALAINEQTDNCYNNLYCKDVSSDINFSGPSICIYSSSSYNNSCTQKNQTYTWKYLSTSTSTSTKQVLGTTNDFYIAYPNNEYGISTTLTIQQGELNQYNVSFGMSNNSSSTQFSTPTMGENYYLAFDSNNNSILIANTTTCSNSTILCDWTLSDA